MQPIAIPGVFTVEECQTLLKETEIAPDDGSFVDQYNVLTNKVSGLYNTIEDQEQADVLFTRILQHIPHDIVPGWRPSGVNESLRMLKYTAGELFPLHVDPDYSRPYGHPQYGDVSFLTLIVYLNDEFTGGNTVFYGGVADGAKDRSTYTSYKIEAAKDNHGPESHRIVPKAGTAVIFMHDAYHMGEIVTSGTKYTLRTDVVFTPL